ncbi:MAG: hypothetical protein V4582_17115 [Pseudomonadota bacterium]
MNSIIDARKPLASLLLAAGMALGAGAAQAADYAAQAPWAEQLIANVATVNNVYGSDPTIVTWAGVNGATIYQNRSTCAAFVSNVMKTSNGISNTSYKAIFGTSSPQSAQYYTNIVNQNHFQRIFNPNDIKRGDIIAAIYMPCANSESTGHTMLALSGATARTVNTLPLVAGTVQYEVTVADSSASNHDAKDSSGVLYPDTRGADGSGAGIGKLRLYQDVATGTIIGYTWTMNRSSIYYANGGCRSIAVGRMF